MIGIIGGTGFYNAGLLGEAVSIEVHTEYGDVTLLKGKYKDVEIVFLPRHGLNHSRLAFEVNHHANMMALKELGVTRVITTVAAGGIKETLNGGDLVLIDQFINFHTRHYTYGKYSLDMTEPYCSELRSIFMEQAEKLGYKLHPHGTYMSVDGPRYETKAEIAAYRILGADVVGMTNAPEASLARELGICYSAVVIVTNKAAGISEDEPDLKTHSEAVKKNTEKLQNLLFSVAASIPEEHHCRCRELYDRASSARQ